jgi:hypothetical protein
MGVRIVCLLMTNRRTFSVFVRHNIVSASTVDWHFPQPIVADRTAHVTGAGG